MAESGNKWLRELSVGQARSLCRATMIGDAEMKARYLEYVMRYVDAERTYTAGWRGIQRGKGISSRRSE